LNIGDYLLGRGYKIVADELGTLGAEKVARIMGKLAECHVKLAEGQGAELLWRKGLTKEIKPIDVLKIYALKTAPAFDAAMYAGMVLAEVDRTWQEPLSDFCKHLGIAYQIQNDLKDMNEDQENKVKAFGDILKGTPTLLFALALESSNDQERAELLRAASVTPDKAEEAGVKIDTLRDLYYKYEIPLQAAMLADQQRQRAMETVKPIRHSGMQALFTFLAATLLE
jgi:geranylgeranyl pyrophosphate synthase